MVSFAQSHQSGIFNAQWIEVSNSTENGPKQFVYYWERTNLHWFLYKLKGTYEIILWSSLPKRITKQIVEHIERTHSYFSYVLNREDCLSFADREPVNSVLANETLTKAAQSMNNWWDVSFAGVNKSLAPAGVVKDITLLLNSREPKNIFVVDWTEKALTYFSGK